MTKKTNVQTNLVGRRARIREKWKPLPPKSPIGLHQEEWGEIVIVHQDADGLHATVRWDDGRMFKFSNPDDWLEVDSGLEAQVSRGVSNMASLTSMVENGNTVVLDAVIDGLERRRVPGGLIEKLKEQRDRICKSNNSGDIRTINLSEEGLQDVAVYTRTGLVVRVCEWESEEDAHIEIHKVEDFGSEAGPDSPGFHECVEPGDHFVDNKLVRSKKG